MTTESFEMYLYGVRRTDRPGWSQGRGWVIAIGDATLHTTIGPARGKLTVATKAGVPCELVRLRITALDVLDETERIEKAKGQQND